MAFDYNDNVTKNVDLETEQEDHSSAMSEVMDSWSSKGAGSGTDSNEAVNAAAKDGGAATRDNTEQVAFKAADVPEVGSYEHMQHLINTGNMIRDGRFTPEAVASMQAYIENGPGNIASPFGGGRAWRTSNVQNLLNETYATGRYGDMRLDGTRPYTPPQYQPFNVSCTPSQWVPHPVQAGGQHVPARLTITQTR